MRLTYLMVWALSLVTLFALAYALSKKERGWFQLGIGSAAFTILLVRWAGSLLSFDQAASTAWLSPIEELVRAWCIFRVLADRAPLSASTSLPFALGAASVEPLINILVAVAVGDIGLSIPGAAGAFGLIATPFVGLFALSLLMATLASYGVRAWLGFLICAGLHAAYNYWGLVTLDYPESPADYLRLAFSRLVLTLPLAAACWFFLCRKERRQAFETPAS